MICLLGSLRYEEEESTIVKKIFLNTSETKIKLQKKILKTFSNCDYLDNGSCMKDVLCLIIYFYQQVKINFT